MHTKFLIRSWPWALCGLLAVAVPASGDTPQQTSKKKPAHHSTAHSSVSKHHASTAHLPTHKGKATRSKAGSRARTKRARKHGQQVIDSKRARQIQEALIREHYLEGAPTGTWDSATQAAMQRYQADQGWQSKTIPDARALIKLGLGPNPEHLLNPESAMTSAVVTSTAAKSDAGAKADPKANPTDPPASTSSKNPTGDTPQR